MIAYYENNRGSRIDLMKAPYRMITADLFSYEWNAIENSDRILGYERVKFEKEVEIDIFGKVDEFADNLNMLIDTFEQDIFDNVKGTLYVNGHYLKCNIQSLDTEDWEAGIYAVATFKVITDEPFWIKDLMMSFYPGSDAGASGGLNYPYNYPYNYTRGSKGVKKWITGALSDNPFEMTIYGPCIDPRVSINGHPYELYDTLEKGDYVKITNYNGKTVTKHRSNGTVANLFDYRAKTDSIFDNVPGGNLTITWSGDFGFDLKIFERRSTPRAVKRGE